MDEQINIETRNYIVERARREFTLSFAKERVDEDLPLAGQLLRWFGEFTVTLPQKALRIIPHGMRERSETPERFRWFKFTAMVMMFSLVLVFSTVGFIYQTLSGGLKLLFGVLTGRSVFLPISELEPTVEKALGMKK